MLLLLEVELVMVLDTLIRAQVLLLLVAAQDKQIKGSPQSPLDKPQAQIVKELVPLLLVY